ncbi:hypothetical protein ACI4B7_27285, partial [Klebsiella pneumoniae]|uniref:hypothetical protein n=1 Tax=Klebsiella pneumoniae TaxID=573 RepID=UPI003852339F
DWPLPEPVDIEERVTALLESAKKTKKLKFKLDYDAQELDDIVQAFRGLTINEIEMIVTYMMTAYNHLDSVIIASKKRDIIRKSGAMDW